MSAVELTGLEGDNPMAMLAALGTLSLASDAFEGAARLSWRPGGRSWTPTISSERAVDRDGLLDAIVSAHRSRDLKGELGWARDVMKTSREEVRRLLSLGLENGDGRPAQMVGACVGELPLRQGDLSSYTPFRLIPRMGRAGFLEAARRVSEPDSKLETRLGEALFGPWRYEGFNSMRWDPLAGISTRALSAEAPTHTGPVGVSGAILLAVRGLVFFPLMLSARRRQVAGMQDGQRRFVWPIWTDPLDEPAVRILFALPSLYDDENPGRHHLLERHGVVARLVAERKRFGADNEALSLGEPV